MRLLRLIVPVADAELGADRLWEAGAGAVEERPTTSPDAVELRTVLAEDDRVSTARVGDLPNPWRLSFVDVADEPNQAWRSHASPIEVHPMLIIRPAWIDPVDRPGALEIAIEPGGSFGLGDHPSTRLSAAATDRLVQPGDRVLDVGCGSGVLSIIAARRGAATITAIDIAEAAREATDANAVRNGAAEIVSAETTPVGSVGGIFDVVLANILAPALVAMADDLRRLTAPAGALVISGVLTGHYGHVIDALAPMRAVDHTSLDGWSAVVLRHS